MDLVDLLHKKKTELHKRNNEKRTNRKRRMRPW